MNQLNEIFLLQLKMNDEEANQIESKEIVIELSNKEDNQDSTQDTPLEQSSMESPKTKPNKTPKFVDKKLIKDLNDDERNLILSNFRAGIDQPYFDVKVFKNGSSKIIKKKVTVPSTAQKVICSNEQLKTQPSDQKVFYSDNQLLFEHIIELNSKVDKLMAKHKKLKRRYQSLQNDLYVEDDDVEQPVNQIPNEPSEDQPNEPVIEQVNEPARLNSYVQPVQRSWRSRLTYL